MPPESTEKPHLVATYEVRHIQLTDKFVAVYWNEVEGGHEKHSYPVAAIAVCRVKEQMWQRSTDAFGRQKAVPVEKECFYYQVCALELDRNGTWQVCEEAKNFIGIRLAGESVDDMRTTAKAGPQINVRSKEQP